MSSHRSIASIQAEIIGILSDGVSKDSKVRFMNEIIRYYPRVFLSVFHADYDTFYGTEELEDRLEESQEVIDQLRYQITSLNVDVEALSKEVQERPTVFHNVASYTLPTFVPTDERDLDDLGKAILPMLKAGGNKIKITIIKHVRKVTDCGLKEAKQYVDALTVRFDPASLEDFVLHQYTKDNPFLQEKPWW